MGAQPRIMRFRWDGRVMVPVYPAVAARQYTEGEVYPLEVREDRSIATHNHYFAALNEGWNNLPELRAGDFPTPEHLRRYLLIKAGYYDSRSIPLHSNAEALRVVGFVKPSEEYGIVTAHEATVTIYTAKSQALRAMGKAEFQRSKEAVLDELAAMLEVERKALEANAGRGA